MKTLLESFAARSRAASNRKKINLGLQGGGAHGAFTWGVLDYCSRTGGSTSRASPAPRPAR